MFGRRGREAEPEPKYLQPYAEVARRVGARFEALLWQNAEGQRIRFEVLAEMIAPEKRAIADMGCGRVDLLEHLHTRGRMPKLYVGVDGVRPMVEAGQQIIDARGYPHACVLGADFVADRDCMSDLITRQGVDTLVFSGSLNTLEQHQAEEVLGRAYDALPSGGLLVFNFLSDLFPGKDTVEHGPAFRFSTLGLVTWALRRSPLVRFRHDYLGGHDATVRVAKP